MQLTLCPDQKTYQKRCGCWRIGHDIY